MSLIDGLLSQGEVVHALILRETRTRFGRHQLGYVWALLEPAIMIVTFYLVFRLARRAPPDGMELFGFVATGVVPYVAFREGADRVSNAISGNKALLFYPHVQPLDIVMARGVLEWATYSAVFIVLMAGHALIAQELSVASPLLVTVGFALASLLGASLGLVFCALAEYSPLIERTKGPLMRPLFWISGIFFTAASLPEEARGALLLNPVLHLVELVRQGWYEAYQPNLYSIPYVLAWVLGLAFVGLTLERLVRRRIEVT